MKIVIGCFHRDYLRWLRENQLSERDARYIGLNQEKLMGLKLAEEDIVRLGPVDWEFEQLLRTRIRR